VDFCEHGEKSSIKQAMFISRMSTNVSPRSGLVVVGTFNTVTATLTFLRSVSMSACVFLSFSISMSRRVVRSFFAFCSHSCAARSYSFELHTSRYSYFTSLHQILSEPPSIECCSTQYLLFTYYTSLPKPHNTTSTGRTICQ
jgi:hypothetical protein